jgi:hypothetical protein
MPAVMTGAVGGGVAVRHENGHMTLNMGHVSRKPVASMPQSLHTRRGFDGRFQAVVDPIIAVYWPFSGHS